jgi:chorismate synthase
MNGTWGNNIRYTIWGESHGTAIGILIDGLPSGIALDFDSIQFEINRRKPGTNGLTTSRKEKDGFKILSGLFNDFTTGSPLCILIENTDTKSEHYTIMKNLMRPSHADYTGYIKYNGFNDYRGGGHFSGRLTAPLVIAGAIAKQILKQNNIVIGSHIKQIGDIVDTSFNMTDIPYELLEKLRKMCFPTINSDKTEKMIQLVNEIKQEGDSIGGLIETAIINLPPGMGSPFFDSFESTLSHIIFSIPSVKGIEFGAGFSLASMKGSKANDELFYDQNKVSTYTNNNGGILGGISNGMPVVFRTVIKPTPSISLQQRTIDIKSQTDSQIQITGRHDPCIVPRAIPAIEAAAAIAVLDMFFEGRKYNLWK